MKEWQVKSFTRSLFEFQLVFNEPMKVSTNEEPDLLLVQIELCDLSTPEVEKRLLSESKEISIVKYINIPIQTADYIDKESFEASSSVTSDTVSSTLGSNLVISILIGGSLSQIWSLLNALQVMQKIRLFAVKAPGTVNSFSNFLD